MSGTCHWAAPGMRCVCVDDNWPELHVDGQIVPARVPMLGEVMTIRRVAAGSDPIEIGWTVYGDPDEIYLSFWEIPVELTAGRHAIGGIPWLASAFRPLAEAKTDISVFTQILDQAPAGARPVVIASAEARHGA